MILCVFLIRKVDFELTSGATKWKTVQIHLWLCLYIVSLNRKKQEVSKHTEVAVKSASADNWNFEIQFQRLERFINCTFVWKAQ